jgi:hypothetical protein
MDAAKLVQVYLKMRDAKELMVREHKTKLSKLTEQMGIVEQELLEICKATGQDGGKTTYGSFSKTIKTRYWTNDWDSMYGFIKENDVPQILERRIHQGNFKEFMEENPDKLPVGLNVDSKYSITVRRAK